MNETELRLIPLTAMFAAAGIIIPQFFHLLGLGATFLPMFLPVMLGSLILTWKFALTLSIVVPVTSFFITGMPPILPPVLPILLTELICVSLILSVLHVHLEQSFWFALIIAIVFDRVLLFLIVSVIAPLFGFTHPLFSIALVSSGIPGIILQLVMIPLAMKYIRQKYPNWLNQIRPKEEDKNESA